MSFLVRAIRYIKYKKIQMLLQVIIFSVVFSFVVAGLVIYCSADNYVKLLEKSVKNCVTVSYISLKYNSSGAINGNDISIECKNIPKLIDYDAVNSFNYSFFDWVSFDGKYNTVPKEKDFGDKFSANKDATIYTTINSRMDSAFTTLGYSLTSGRHIVENEADKNICMVSKRFADLNNLKIGDKISAKRTGTSKEVVYDLEIVGIFDTPKGEYRTGYGDSPNELIIVPTENDMITQNSTFTVSVYLNRGEDIEKYINYLKENLNIRKVSYTRYDYSVPPVPKEAENLSFEETVDYYTENQYMDVYIDSQWYDMVAKPTEKVRDLSEFLVAGFAIGAFLIILLFCTATIRKRQREFGVLLSIGEDRAKIVGQVCVEIFVTVTISAFIGLLAGIFVSVPLAQSYTNSAYNAQAEIDSQKNAILGSEYTNQTDPTDLGFNHAAMYDLLYKNAGRTTVAPNISPYYSVEIFLSYIVVVVIIMLFSVLIQMLYITGVKPIKLLLRRK